MSYRKGRANLTWLAMKLQLSEGTILSTFRNPHSAIRIRQSKQSAIVRLLAVLLLLVFVARLYHSIRVHSLTVDEPTHIAAGFAHLAVRDFRINPEHPPLAKMTAVLLPHLTLGRVAIDSLKYPLTEDSMDRYVDDFSAALGDHRQMYIDRARIGPVLISTLLAVMLFLSARHFYRREWIALSILFVYTMEPTVLAHSTIVHTDVPSALGYLAGFLTLYWWWLRPSVARAAALGLVIGLACLMKFSMLLLPVFALLMWGIKASRELFGNGKNASTAAGGKRFPTVWVRSHVLQMLVAAVVLYLSILAGYLFVDIYRPLYLNQGVLSRLPWPNYFLRGVCGIIEHQESGHLAYFFGEFSKKGWWLYFPAAFVLKVPLAVLFLSAVGAVAWIRRRTGVERNLWLLMISTYIVSSILSTINIGVRHLLPLFPLLMLAMGEGVEMLLEWARRVAMLVLAASLIWLGAVSFWIQPHYLAYFNELVGGPGHGWRYLSDSNTDWGQNSRLWAEYVGRYPQTEFFTALQQADSPSNYGITENNDLDVAFEDLKENDFSEGTYAVSTLFLISPRIPQLVFLRELQPVDQIGYTIRVYRIGEAEQDQYEEWLKSWKANRKER
ncbi:MAG TPA: hypothetical protein VGL91_11775 [Acidobacteriota bacterium]